MTLPETSRRNPVGIQESCQQPKASLAWGHVSALHPGCGFPAKPTNAVRRCPQRRCRTIMLSSPEIAVVGVLVLIPKRGQKPCIAMA
jgi:hypothetical protein